jgi:hypothetical protein
MYVPNTTEALNDHIRVFAGFEDALNVSYGSPLTIQSEIYLRRPYSLASRRCWPFLCIVIVIDGLIKKLFDGKS